MRTILADREPTVRNALRTLLTQGLGMQVVGEAETAASLERQARLQAPDLAVVAWDLVASGGGPALTRLRSVSEGLRVVVLGARPEIRHAALQAGADGFICMVDAPEVVIRVLRESRDAVNDVESRRPAPERGGATNASGGVS
jgi:DNA-binding NarL/FixJ family response regulator